MAAASHVVILGDLHGHLGLLTRSLEGLGVELERQGELPVAITHWPAGLHIVQAGDLIHKGPSSELLLAVVNDVLLPTGRWTQLIGNHEAQYLDEGARFWAPTIHVKFHQLLRDWVENGDACLAAAVSSPTEQLLISHAGLVPLLWDAIGQPDDVGDAAAAINAPSARKMMLAPGMMLGSAQTAGVVWALAREELHGQWHRRVSQGGRLPFSMVHGHTQPLLFRPKRAPAVPEGMQDTTVFDQSRNHTVTTLDGGRIVAIDAGPHERRQVLPTPLVIPEGHLSRNSGRTAAA